MAFTDMEVAAAQHAAAARNATHADLYKLGLIYSTGNGADVDLVQAHMWFNLAAQRGSADARESRRELADQMNAHEIAAAQRAAREWLRRRC
jgi:TPR repeat protein